MPVKEHNDGRVPYQMEQVAIDEAFWEGMTILYHLALLMLVGMQS